MPSSIAIEQKMKPNEASRELMTLFGSRHSAKKATAPAALLNTGVFDPPVTRMLPSARMTALLCRRGNAIDVFAVQTGVAGLSIEDNSYDKEKPLYDVDQAVARMRAAREAIDNSGADVLLTGRAEAFLVGKPAAPDNINEAARLAMEESDPVEDDRGPIDYKRAMVRELTRRALRRALARAQGAQA